MTRYLLFDGGCGTCTHLAREIEQIAEGWLSAKDLQEKEIQSILQKVAPDWRWQPTLLIIQKDKVRVFTGLALAIRLSMGLGLGRSWRILEIIQGSDKLIATGKERRQFLKNSAAFAASVVLLPNILKAKPYHAKRNLMSDPLTPEFPPDDEVQSYIQGALATEELQLLTEHMGPVDATTAMVRVYHQSSQEKRVEVEFTIPNKSIIIHRSIHNPNTSSYIMGDAKYYRYGFTSHGEGAKFVTGFSNDGNRVKPLNQSDVLAGDICYDNGCLPEPASYCEFCSRWSIRVVYGYCCYCIGLCHWDEYGPCNRYC